MDVTTKNPGGRVLDKVMEDLGTVQSKDASGAKRDPPPTAGIEALNWLVGPHTVFLEVAFKGKSPLLGLSQNVADQDTCKAIKAGEALND